MIIIDISLEPFTLNFLIFSAILVSGLVINWVFFWRTFKTKPEIAANVFREQNVLSVLTVMFIVVITGILGFLSLVDSSTIAAIYSGIVGYVLGSIKLSK